MRIPAHWRATLGRARDKLWQLADQMAAHTRQPPERHGIAILMPHGLGDLIIFTAAYRHIAAHYTGQPVWLICSPANAAYARAYLGAHRIIVLDRLRFRRNLWARMRIVRAIARAGLAAIIQPARNREFMVEDALVRASGATARAGAAGTAAFISAAQRAAGDPWYTRLHPDPRGALHDATHYAAFTAWLTGSAPAALISPLPPPPRLAQAPAGSYLLVIGEASSVIKEWPLGEFLSAAAAIAAAHGLAIVLAGEHGAGDTPGSKITDLRGQSAIQDLAALCAHARLVLCNDSGPAHLAAVLSVPAVVIGNGGMPARYLPYPEDAPGIFAPILVQADPPPPCFGCGWRCIHLPPPGAPVPCIAAVKTAAVIAAGHEVLRQTGTTP